MSADVPMPKHKKPVFNVYTGGDLVEPEPKPQAEDGSVKIDMEGFTPPPLPAPLPGPIAEWCLGWKPLADMPWDDPKFTKGGRLTPGKLLDQFERDLVKPEMGEDERRAVMLKAWGDSVHFLADQRAQALSNRYAGHLREEVLRRLREKRVPGSEIDASFKRHYDTWRKA